MDALQLLAGNVKRILGPPWRYLFRVTSSTATAENKKRCTYNYMLPVGNCCDCEDSEADTWCVHLLAVKIAALAGDYESLHVTDTEFERLLNQFVGV